MERSTKTRRRGRLGLVLGLAVSALACAAVAYADTTVSDGDGVTPVANQNMSFGSVSCATATAKSALVAISRNGNAGSTNVFKDGATVTVSVQSVTGAGLSASIGAPATITLPANWGTLDNTTLSSALTSTVTVNSTTPGAGTGTVTYQAVGLNASNDTITRTDPMTVSWTTGSCAPTDGTAPSGTVAIDGNAAYTNSTSVDLDLSASDAVGVTSYRVATGGDCSAATWVAVPAAASFVQTIPHSLVSGDGAQTVCAQYRDAAGNVSATATDTIVLDTLAPVLQDAGIQSGTPGANGWYVSAVVNRFTATDAGSGLDPACASAYPRNVSTGSDEGTAVMVSSGACSDLAGNTNPGISSASFRIDLTDPTAILAVTGGTPGANGWYTSDVTVETTGTDTISGPVTCTTSQAQTTETTGHVFSGSCTNEAGLIGSATPLTVKLDKTAPSATLTASGTQGANGWFLDDVTVKTTGADAISGPVACTPDQVQTTETGGQSFNGSCTNQAGLIGSATSLVVKLDKTNPSVAITSPVGGTTTIATSVTVSGTDSDAPSGIAGVTVNGVAATLGSGTFTKTGIALACGTNTLAAVATDHAGRTATESVTVTRQCFALQFLQPLDQSISAPIMNKGKYGRVIPVKVLLTLASGTALDSAELASNGWTLQMGVNGASCSSGAGTDDIEAYADAGASAGSSNLFRWDSNAAQWSYNLDTKAPPGMTMTVGNCYRLDVYVSDGSSKVIVSGATYVVFQPTR